ncbi:hypothetical protein AY600_04195 [Phormidium willei BDU 130791]|nr:hypothetical protein AY600_04195 [Phormidium willei BDU 130791]
MILSIMAIYQVLWLRLQERTHHNLNQGVENFNTRFNFESRDLNQVKISNVRDAFDEYIHQTVPYDGIFIITFLDNKIYKSSPSALPKSLQANPDIFNQLASLDVSRQGQYTTRTDTLIYRSHAIATEEVEAMLIIVQSMEGEIAEIREAVVVAIQVSLGVFIGFAILMWWVAGRTLSPLRVLRETVDSISESNLAQRIPVRGDDELTQLTVRFNEMLDRLEMAFTSQRDLLNDIGHELRTPITIIQGHLELMGLDPNEQQETMAIVGDELDRMSGLINNLLLLAKSERPDFLNLEVIDLPQLMEDVFRKITALGDRHWRLAERPNVKLVGDRKRLTQALINLADNATKHTKPGDDIILGSGREMDWICIWLKDCGCGITAENQARIFERFERGNGITSQEDGSGLGLAIVRAIAQAHGGQIQVESMIDQGSTFRLYLPLETS